MSQDRAKQRVAVTGGSGKVGRASVRQLLESGYEVVNLDAVAPSEPLCRFTRIDFTDYGQVLEAFTAIDGGWEGLDAVVHLAAIPGPSHAGNAKTFANNAVSTFNVFQAARHAGIRNIVWASSETLLGIPFDSPPPYLPLDEYVERRPETSYSLAKLVDETIAEQFCRWDPKLKAIGLRFSYVKEEAEYSAFASINEDPGLQYWNFWSYIDVRDAAQAVQKALEYEPPGLAVFIIASPDTVVDRSTGSLLKEYFPTVPLKKEFGEHESVLSTEKARELLGWKPRHSWRRG
jgi:nucleoside-diphosphate-sugar epimerase